MQTKIRSCKGEFFLKIDKRAGQISIHMQDVITVQREFLKKKKCADQNKTVQGGFMTYSRHRTTKFPNSESPIFTTKFCLSYFLLDQKQDQQSAAPSITLSKRASKK